MLLEEIEPKQRFVSFECHTLHILYIFLYYMHYVYFCSFELFINV